MIIGLTGKMQHGKSTVANILAEEFGFTVLGFADGVRAVAEAVNPFVEFIGEKVVYERYVDLVARLGYEEVKRQPDARRLLQRIGTEGGRGVLGPDVWVAALEQTMRKLPAGTENVVIADVRFPNEAQFIADMGGTLVRVERPGLPDSGDTHESEQHADALEVSSIIDNKGTIDLLRAQVRALYAASVEGGF